MTVGEAVEFFNDFAGIQDSLRPLRLVGLDYLRLGQPLTTLSGGESQRLKLAAHMARAKMSGTLVKASYVMAYFDSESYSLRLAESHDGFAWTEIEGVDFAPRIGDWKTFRDPSLLQDVEGRFRLTWTTGSNGFGYARSEDLFE